MGALPRIFIFLFSLLTAHPAFSQNASAPQALLTYRGNPKSPIHSLTAEGPCQTHLFPYHLGDHPHGLVIADGGFQDLKPLENQFADAEIFENRALDFLNQSRDDYGLIFLLLSENSQDLITNQAFQIYFDRLSGNGVLFLESKDLTPLANEAVSAMQEQGFKNPQAHLLGYRYGSEACQREVLAVHLTSLNEDHLNFYYTWAGTVDIRATSSTNVQWHLAFTYVPYETTGTELEKVILQGHSPTS